tara:strand:+ start:5240 stop:5485 length:246 start_codon:yes stop_codon:yes gene_type:complete
MSEKIIEELEKVSAGIEKAKHETEEKLKTVEDNLHDTKLNPYGVTTIDFSERQELMEDVLKMEGTMMGLKLAIETCQENAF